MTLRLGRSGLQSHGGAGLRTHPAQRGGLQDEYVEAGRLPNDLAWMAHVAHHHLVRADLELDV